MNSLMSLMFEVMCNQLVMMCGVWQRGEVMLQEEVTFRSLTERTKVNKKMSFQTLDKLNHND
jgi:hypothetical protein